MTKSSAGRSKVKDLPKKERKLRTGEMKKVKGGSYEMSKSDNIKAPKPKGFTGPYGSYGSQ